MLPSSVEVAQKIHYLTDTVDIPVLLSQTVMYNPFPWLYRGDSQHIVELPDYQAIPCGTCDNYTSAEQYPDAEAFLKQTLESAEDQSITYVCTASLSNLAAVLMENPELESKVKEVMWMGGAINVPGNMEVDQFDYTIWNTKAEWNVFADPFKAAYIFANTSIPVSMFPLDIANSAPVNGTFIETLEAQATNSTDDNSIDNLMYIIYDQIAMPQKMYKLWNVVVVAYLSPNLQQYYAPPENLNVTIVTTFEDQGWTKRMGLEPEEAASAYRPVSAFLKFNDEDDTQSWIKGVALGSVTA